MILSTLKDCSRYEAIDAKLKLAFDYIKANDLLNAPLGKIELDGKNVFINNSLIGADKIGKKESQKLEYHKDYLDIHIVLEGKEIQGWKDLSKAEDLGEYNETKDVAFSTDRPTSFVEILPGEFTIVYPEDMHAPNISDEPIRKLVVKIKVR